MERSRFPPTSRKLLRHSPRNKPYRFSRGHVHALITLLLFCVLAISHSELSAAKAGNFARRFISPITQQESSVSRFPLWKHANLPPSDNVRYRAQAERKPEEGAQSWNESHLLRQERSEDEDLDTEIDVDGDVAMEEDLEGNVEEQEEQQQQKEADDVERDEEAVKHEKEDSEGVEGWYGVSLNASMRRADPMPTWVRDNMTSEKVLAGSAHGRSRTKNFLFKHGGIKTLPRWDPLENVGDRRKPSNAERNHSPWRSPRSSAIKWDHLLGVVRQIGNFKSSSTLLQSRKVKLGADHFIPSSLKDSDSSSDGAHIFGSDDEAVDWNVRDHVEEVATIEDALLLRIHKAKNANWHSWADKKLKGDAYKKERQSKNFVELLNPMNNPLLQDPDTPNPNGLSGNDRAMLKALRTTTDKVVASDLTRLEAEHKSADTKSFRESSQDVLVTNRKSRETSAILENAGGQPGNAAERSILEFSTFDSYVTSEAAGNEDDAGIPMRKSRILSSDLTMDRRPKSFVDTRKWGFYPGMNSKLAFSDFMEQFLEDEKCSHKVFMVWTTPPWTYTVRYQRGLESIFYFHPRACVVVFSTSIELDFFMSFVEEGFRVAVVVPNLEELLAGTPADVFASFWLPWKKTHFFHIHCSELLRLAALYKYGGIYLDTDVLLLKPFTLQRNTIGAEQVENGARKLNGAVMAFEKNSLFLLECLVEFTATYDDQLLELNGAGLVTRVANRIANAEKRTNEEFTGELWIEERYAFFPLSREDITRYFRAPESKEQELETDRLTQSILNQSSMLHFWNQRTHFLVPEASSLVERILNRHCIKCNDYL